MCPQGVLPSIWSIFSALCLLRPLFRLPMDLKGFIFFLQRFQLHLFTFNFLMHLLRRVFYRH